MTQMNRIANTIASGPQNGVSTHHHDQVIDNTAQFQCDENQAKNRTKWETA